MSDITLSAGVRQNLLSLQNTASLMAQTQNRLATGKKVNSALDNPLNFFTSSSLSARAHDLGGLLDAMSNGIQTIQAGNNGITAMTSLVQQLQATVSQARSDSTAAAVTPGTLDATANNSTGANNKLTFDFGNGVTVGVNTYANAVASTLTASGADYTADVSALSLTIDDGATGGTTIDITGIDGTNTVQDLVDQINTDLSADGSTVIAINDGGNVRLVNATGEAITVSGTAATTLGFGAGNTVSTDGSVAAALTNTQIAAAINANSVLSGKVSASVSAGTLTIKNLTNSDITVKGYDGTDVSGDAADVDTLDAGTGATLSSVRQSLLNQFNTLLTQIDKTALDSGYNGINLLNADKLTVQFNENGTSSIDVQAKDASGNAFAINSTNLGINTQTSGDFASNTTLDTLAATLTTALTTLRTQASSLGSQLSIVQTRQDFTKNMINTLQVGSDNLVLADTNEEGANMLALQTRQSLSTTALSLASQADQNVLQLFQ